MFYVHEVRNLLGASNFRTPARPAGFENFWPRSIGGSGSLLRNVRSTPDSVAKIVLQKASEILGPRGKRKQPEVALRPTACFAPCLALQYRTWRSLPPPQRLYVGEYEMTDGNADLDALVQQTMAIAKSIRVEPNVSERDGIRQRVSNFKAHQERLARGQQDFAATQSIFNIVKAPLGWLIYSDGVKVGGVCGSREAAFEAATIAATFAVRDGAGVQINVPSAPEADEIEIPRNWISAIK